MLKRHVLNTYHFNLDYARRLVADLDDPQMCALPQAGMNHGAWVIGHLASTCDFMGSLMGMQPLSPPEWKTLFGGGSKPVCEPDKYPGKGALLTALEDGHAHVAGLFEYVTDAITDKPTPIERMRPRFPTIGDLLIFGLTSHETLHLGQLSAWRRAQGLPSAL